MCELDEQDGKPIREYSKKSGCPYCIPEIVDMGHGDFYEYLECYCQTDIEPFAPGIPEPRY